MRKLIVYAPWCVFPVLPVILFAAGESNTNRNIVEFYPSSSGAVHRIIIRGSLYAIDEGACGRYVYVYRSKSGYYSVVSGDIERAGVMINDQLLDVEKAEFIIRESLTPVMVALFAERYSYLVDAGYLNSRQGYGGGLWRPYTDNLDDVDLGTEVLSKYVNNELTVEDDDWALSAYIINEQGGVYNLIAKGHVYPFVIFEVIKTQCEPNGTVIPNPVPGMEPWRFHK